jgi:hypothetical protein
MCSSRLWICEACEKPAPCLCTDCVENSPGISGSSLQAHRAVVLEQRMEGVVADPRLVPEHVVAEVADLLSTLRRCRPCRRRSRAGCRRGGTGARPWSVLVLHQRIAADLLAQILSSQASQSTAPIMPKALRAVGRKTGNGAGLDQARPDAATCDCCGRRAPESPRCSSACDDLVRVLVPFRTK